MYLLMGGDAVVLAREVIAIIDLTHKDAGAVMDCPIGPLSTIDHGDAKSLVVTTGLNYLSTVSAVTLKKRMLSITEDRK